MDHNDVAKDASDNDRHALFLIRPQKIVRGCAPIIGSGMSYRFNRGGYLDLGTLEKIVGSQMQQGFTLAIDIQSRSKALQTICGTRGSGQPTLIITLNEHGTYGRLQVEVGDNNGRRLIGLYNYLQPPRNA